MVRRCIWLHLAGRDSKGAQGRMWLGSIKQPFISGLLQLRGYQGWLLRQRSIELLIDSGCNGFMIKNKELFSDLVEGFLADVSNTNSIRSERTWDSAMLCEGQYEPFLSTGTEGCILGAILREESGVGQTIDGQGGNDPVR